jgi:hypothetical protein
LDWDVLDPAFRAAIDAAIERAIRNQAAREDRFGGKLGADPIADARASRHKRGKKIRQPEKAAKNFRAAFSWLIRHAFPVRSEAAALRSLPDLMRPAVITRATDSYAAHATSDPALLAADTPATGVLMLRRLATIAQRNAMDEKVLWAIEDYADRNDLAAPQDREMSAMRHAGACEQLLRNDTPHARARLQKTQPRLEESGPVCLGPPPLSQRSGTAIGTAPDHPIATTSSTTRSCWIFMVLPDRIELSTSPLPRPMLALSIMLISFPFLGHAQRPPPDFPKAVHQSRLGRWSCRCARSAEPSRRFSSRLASGASPDRVCGGRTTSPMCAADRAGGSRQARPSGALSATRS